VAKQKVSVTLSPERLDRARAVTGTANLSELLELALDALVELERRWLAAHEHETNDDLPGEVPIDLAEVPWQGR
jgi:hypothetical protein